MADESKCIITGLSISNLSKSEHGFFYDITLNGKEVEFRFCSDCIRRKKYDLIANRHIIIGLLLNNKIYKSGNELMHWDHSGKDGDSNFDLKSAIETGVYPKTPHEKMQNLFIDLYKLQSYEGQWLETSSYITDNQAWKLYFRNRNEMKHYLKSLSKVGDVELKYNPEGDTIPALNITFQGLNTYTTLVTQGINSKNCFVAMNFDNTPAIKEIEKAIRQGIIDAGYNPILVSDRHINSDKTIPDEIIYLIRSCKFCIADFTGQKAGVYFESGFALGLGKPVIYTCHEPSFDKAHFDIKQLQHILYNSPGELQKALTDKIRAWIQ